MHNLTAQPPHHQHEMLALSSLRRRWAVVAMLYASAWWLGYQLLQSFWHTPLAARWRIFSATMILILLGILWRGLRNNRQNEQSVLWPTFGYGNGLSLVRGGLLILLAGFLFLPRPTIALTWLPALLYTADRIIDLFDGYLARVTGRESKLGAMLDIELDGLGLLVVVLLGVQYGLLPPWYLILAGSRQLFVAGMWLRTRWDKPNRPLPPSDNRRVIAGFQTGFLSVMLWPIMTPELTHLLAILFAIPLFYSFGRDWLVVSYRIDPDSAAYTRGRGLIKAFFEQWLGLGLRIVGTGLVLQLLWQGFPTFARWTPILVQMGWGDALWLRIGLALLLAVATLAFALGYAPRVAGLVLVAFAILNIHTTGFGWNTSTLLLLCAVIVAHLGSGYWSSWQPEDRFLRTQMGRQVRGTRE